MKIINICANYGGTRDGIGDYSKKILENIKEIDKEIEIDNFSSDIQNYSKIHRIISLKMSNNIKKAYKAIKREKYDIVNIEYPFTEWNPLIVLFYRRLVRISKKKQVKVCISLHEYERVNKLRKLVIEQLVKKADFVLVTSESTKKFIEKYNDKIYIRDIPSNIPKGKEVETKKKEINTFVYFGLINSSKAFKEMIDGWISNYNKYPDNKLIIITSSETDIKDDYGIQVKRNLQEKEIEDIMQKSTYTILPIKPNINFNNATLKTATLFGNVPIGVFSDIIKDSDKPFFLNMKNYETTEFSRIFDYVDKVDKKELEKLQYNAIDFGKKYEIKNIANVIYNIFNKEVKNK